MRKRLVEQVQARAPGTDLGFVLRQRGMFSYSGLTREQVRRLREEYSIYAIDSGRICVAALNTKNVDYVAGAIAKVIG
jgi:aromatic-amino-acid transaminase